MSALKPFGFLYEKAAGVKNLLYDNQVLNSVKLPVPVISLGNLTMGGTGKTPLTHLCLQYFRKRNAKVAVVSRNYRAEVKELAKVELKRPNAAQYFGDEPVLLAHKNHEASFYVGPQKFKTAQFAYEDSKPDVILVDDGFQHRQLSRDVDLVILDATEAWSNYECVPVGRAREAFTSLHRASAVLITKRNLASGTALHSLLKKLEGFRKPIAVFDFEIGDWVVAAGVPAKGEAPLNRESVFAISAIGRPQSFQSSLESSGAKLVTHRQFKDHHAYTSEDVQSILQEAKQYGSGISFVTTEKDAVKLKNLWPANVPLWAAPLEVRIHSGEEAFYEILAQVLR